MQIIEIKKVTDKKAKVFFDRGASLVLYSGEIKKLNWREGDEIGQEAYDRVRAETVTKRAKLYAMRLLQDQDRTEKELTDKIVRAGYDPEIAAEALAYVKKFGYVNDRRYAENYAGRYRGARSIKQIRQELKKRGIPAQIIEDVTADAGEEDEYTAIVRLLVKRRYDPRASEEENDPEKQRRERDKQLRYLASKGFSYAAVRYVFDHFEELKEESCRTF